MRGVVVYYVGGRYFVDFVWYVRIDERVEWIRSEVRGRWMEEGFIWNIYLGGGNDNDGRWGRKDERWWWEKEECGDGMLGK